MRALIPTETQEQIALIQWFDLWAPAHLKERLASVPNGGWRSPKTAAILKATGVRKGFPDLMLLAPRGGYAGLFIELKRRRRSKTYTEQLQWHEWLRSQGFAVYICMGFDEAKHCIEQYLYAGKSS